MIAGIVFVASAICIIRKRTLSPKILAFAALIAVGALSIQMRRSSASEQSLWFGGVEVQLTAHVITEGEIQSEGDSSYRQRVDIETEAIDSGSQTQRIAEGIRLSIYQNDRRDSHHQMRLLSYGERLRFRTTLVLPRNYRNPGAFDYTGYLRDNGIVATASVKYSGVEILSGFYGSKIESWRARAHRSIIGKIHALWPEQIAGLMDAIVLGEETFVERPTRVDFQRSGTYHVLVVSGMNVSILAMFALWSLRRIGLGQVAASACAIVVILAYAALTKEGPPVWRAALMFAAYLCARLVYRDRVMLNALGAAALLLLIADPRVLFGASFQMTFLCVALVAGIGVPVLERTIQPYSRGLRNLNALAYDRALPPKIAQFRLDIRLLLNRFAMIVPGRLPRGATLMLFRISFAIFELTVMSAILQLGLALPMAYYFHRATSVAMPANLFVIPFLELLMPAAVCAICLSYVWLTIAKVPALIAAFALQGIAGTVKWLGGMRLADIRVPTPSLGAIVFSVFAILICAIFVRKKTALAFAGIAVLSASALWIWLIPPHQDIHPNILEMTARSMLARAIQFCWSRPKAASCWLTPADCPSGRTHRWISARTWSHLIYGRAEFRGLTSWHSHTPTPITWAECLPSWRIFDRASYGCLRAFRTRKSRGFWMRPIHTVSGSFTAKRATGFSTAEQVFGYLHRQPNLRAVTPAAIPIATMSLW